ncbi:hypothetical protein Adt_24104 [Abeliophyllum distichum]|uniref:Uncharacterized protein n=1 Tax=Abeliophyllum distichum TaxID=126358 RepID=A0ABD1SEE0_9LAMI
MGCGLSKVDSELVNFCRERKESIRAARDFRYTLACAHVTYFHSLQDVESAIRNFMEEALVISTNSPDVTGPHYRCMEEVSLLENFSFVSDEDEDVSLTGYVHEGLNSSDLLSQNESERVLNPYRPNNKKSSSEVPTRILQQPQIKHKNTWEHYSMSSFTDQPHHGTFDGQTWFSSSSFRFPHSGGGKFSPSGSFAFPSRNGSFVDEFVYDAPNNSSGQVNCPSNRVGLSQNENVMPFGGPMNFLPNKFRFNLDASRESLGGQTDFPVMDPTIFHPGNGVQKSFSMNFLPSDPHYNQTPSHFLPFSSPPHPEISSLNYLNPFNLAEDTFLDYYLQASYNYNTGSTPYDTDLREIREREGIPDLEDAPHDNILEDSSSEEDLESTEKSDEGLSGKGAGNNGKKFHLDQDKEVKRPKDGLTDEENEKEGFVDADETEMESRTRSSPTKIMKVDAMKKSEIFEGEEVSNQKDMKKSETSKGQEVCSQTERKNSDTSERRLSCNQIDKTVRKVTSTTLVHSSRDLQEVLNEIKDAFDTILMHGKDVSVMLDAGFSSCIGSSTGPSNAMSSTSAYWMSKGPFPRILKIVDDGSLNIENNISMASCNLLVILEKLYVWENKLYKEVKDEERLRVNFDKEWRKMKKLDDRGAEPLKIDASQSSVRRLIPTINVAISTVGGIARRTHRITVEELQPQLCELIHRLKQMWKSLFESRKKQVQAIMEAKSHVAMTCMTSDSSLNATRKLEMEIKRLGTAFSDWIKSYKAFAELLKIWLMKCLDQKPAENPKDDASSSTSSPGASNIFVISNDWYDAVGKVSETEVLMSINNLAMLLNELCQNLHGERYLRHKIEYLSSYQEKRLKKFCTESGMDWDQCASIFDEADLTITIETGNRSLDAAYANLKSVRKRLNEAKTKHEEVTKQVNDAASHLLSTGFVPVFEALKSFNLEMFNAYEQIRIRS